VVTGTHKTWIHKYYPSKNFITFRIQNV